MEDLQTNAPNYLVDPRYGPVIGLYTDKQSLLDSLEDDAWEAKPGYEANFGFPGITGHRDAEQCFDLDYLMELLQAIDDESASNQAVKISLSDNGPISVATVYEGNSAVASLAPIRENHYRAVPLQDVRRDLLGFYVRCSGDDCEWKSDRYDEEEDAVEACKDHHYFTGHHVKVYDYNGEVIEERGENQ